MKLSRFTSNQHKTLSRAAHYIRCSLGPILLFLGISCSLISEDISTDPSNKLRFSADTVFFDTLFSEIPSITKRLRVFNDNPAAIDIATIKLKDPESPYILTINGTQNTSFESVKLLKGDSLLILLNANINSRDNDLPYIIEDKLEFITNGNNQEVSILSWGQDAIFLKDSILGCNTTLSAGKPYIIYDNVLVDSLCSLTIEPGAKIYAHFESKIYVKGTIIVNGTSENRVVFTNDRFDGDYQTYPGQWGGITFLQGSHDNSIRYADIRNAEYGIWLGTPDDDDIADLVLENSIIENSSNSAVLAFTSDLTMNNCLLANSGELLFGGLAGGNYLLHHNTIVNYGFGFFKTQPSFYVSNSLELADGSTIQAAVNIEIGNSIIWGSGLEEIILDESADEIFNLSMANNILRTTNDKFFNFGNIINEDPLFEDLESWNYQLGENSPAVNAGLELGYLIDLLGRSRTSPPDIGCYEKQ